MNFGVIVHVSRAKTGSLHPTSMIYHGIFFGFSFSFNFNTEITSKGCTDQSSKHEVKCALIRITSFDLIKLMSQRRCALLKSRLYSQLRPKELDDLFEESHGESD